jgi:hypothetical protein
MNGGWPIGAPFDQAPAPAENDPIGRENWRARLVTAGFVPTPICVIGTVDDGKRWAEVYEEDTYAPGRPPHFLVRLVVHGECEHVFTLADLPELLRHRDRLAPLLRRVAKGRAKGRAGPDDGQARRAPASARRSSNR